MNQPSSFSISNLKTWRKKASVVAAVVSILVFVTLIVAQAPSGAKPASESSEVATIDTYCKELDDFKNSERNRARILGGEVDQTGATKWKEFKSRRAREKVYLLDAADVWMKNGKPVV